MRSFQSIDDARMAEYFEDKIAVAQAIIDRCIRLYDTSGERRSVTWDMIIAELRALREGVLK